MGWTAHHGPVASVDMDIAGVLLTGGTVVLFLLVGPTAFVSPAIWNGPPDVALRLISEHAVLWRVANVGFALATIVTAAGLVLVPGRVGEAGGEFAQIAVATYLIAAVPWLLMLAIRIAVTPEVADRFLADTTIDPAWLALDRLGQACFPVFILVTSASLVALGAAVVSGGSVAAPVGWLCIASGLAIGLSYLGIGDTLPAFVYPPTAAVGIALLLAGG